MKILFVTFGELRARGGGARPVATINALAEAGHQLRIIAAETDFHDHPNIQVLSGQGDKVSLRKLRMAVAKATSSMKFDVVHAVDAAAPFCMQICRIRKLKLIYEASRCFTGRFAQPISKRWKWFPNHYRAKEFQLLRRADAIIVPHGELSGDLKTIFPGLNLTLIEDVPLQSLWQCSEKGQEKLSKRLETSGSCLVVCSVEAVNHSDLRKLLMATRKVIDTFSSISFIFKGLEATEAESMAASLDIGKRCCFLDLDEEELYLCALDVAQASLLIPASEKRYASPEILTLLNTQSPLVHIHDDASESVLSEENSVPVLKNTESIAEGILHVLQEPLFALGLSTAGRQLIADRYSLSSFKHKLRMLYHETLNPT